MEGNRKVTRKYGPRLRKPLSPEAVLRREQMVQLRMQGKTLQEIGDKFGITRERVRQLTHGTVRIDVIRSRLDRRIDRRTTPERRALERVAKWWSQVDRTSTPDGCWNWTGAINPQTHYGSCNLAIFGGEGSTHRQSFYLANGYFPKRPMGVLHRCGNRACVRPDHLYEGSQADNMADAITARNGVHWTNGRSYRHKNNAERDGKIVALHASGATAAELAGKFALSEGRIRCIIKDAKS